MSLVFSGVDVEDEIIGESISIRKPVRVATTVNGLLATAYEDGKIVDGTVINTWDRILLKNQTVSIDNGIYIVTFSGSPSRAEDYDIGLEVGGTTVTCLEGTVNGGSGFLCTNVSGSDVVATDGLTYKEYTGDVSLDKIQTLTNKTITDTTNDVAAKFLHSASTFVDVSAASAPTAGQVLMATSSTAATWQTPNAHSQFSTTTTISTTSTTFVLMPDMTFTPGVAGNYFVSANGIGFNTANTEDVEFQLWTTDLGAIAESRARVTNNGRQTWTITYIVAYTTGDIELRWRASANTGRCTHRRFTLIKLD